VVRLKKTTKSKREGKNKGVKQEKTPLVSWRETRQPTCGKQAQVGKKTRSGTRSVQLPLTSQRTPGGARLKRTGAREAKKRANAEEPPSVIGGSPTKETGNNLPIIAEDKN